MDELLALHADYYDYNPPNIITYDDPPDAVTFARQISEGKPAKYLLSGDNGWSRALEWTAKELCALVKEEIPVAVTPNGRADALHWDADSSQYLFVEPAEELMTMRELLEAIKEPQKGKVHYFQSQNGNLSTTALQNLISIGNLPESIDFADEAINSQPDAVNLWIGNHQSHTSLHRDPYENLYVVLSGAKHFQLYAPIEEITLPCKFVATGKWKYDAETGQFSIVKGPQDEKIPWIALELDDNRPERQGNGELEGTQLLKHARVQHVTVKKGEMLFLPSGWFHAVGQTCNDSDQLPCVAVNYWYDQSYSGERFVTRQHISRLLEKLRS